MISIWMQKKKKVAPALLFLDTCTLQISWSQGVEMQSRGCFFTHSKEYVKKYLLDCFKRLLQVPIDCFEEFGGHAKGGGSQECVVS